MPTSRAARIALLASRRSSAGRRPRRRGGRPRRGRRAPRPARGPALGSHSHRLDAGRPRGRPSGSRERTVTSSPRADERLRRCASPIRPVAPVTVTRIRRPPSSVWSVQGRDQAGRTRVHRGWLPKHPRALPHRRQLARLPRVLRAPRVDRDLDRLPHQRDLRVRLHAREDPHRARHEAHGRGLGRGLLRPQGGLSRVQGRPREAPDAARRAVAALRAARRGVRLPHRPPASTASRPTTSSPPSPSRRATPIRRSRPVIVTGDPRRLPAHRSRGDRPGHGDEPRHHRDEAVRPPRGGRALRHPARADPRLLRPQGRDQRQLPLGFPESGTRRPPSSCSSGATWTACSATSTTSRRAKRKQNLTEHSDAARVSKELATIRRDIPVDLDLAGAVAQTPDRSRLREVFREFELRDPLRRLEEVLGEDEAAPAPVPTTTVGAEVRTGTLIDLSGLPDAEVGARRGSPPEAPEGELFGVDGPWRFAARERHRRARRRGGRSRRRRPRDRRPPRRGPRREARSKESRPNLVHDTLLGAYLLEPARRGYPFRELVEERGLAADIGPLLRGDAVLTERARRVAARAARGPRPPWRS